VDNVCCGAACTSECYACSNALTGLADGNCQPIKPGIPDTNATTTCSGTNACDGAGFCKLANGQTSVDPASCVSGELSDGVCCDSTCLTACFACLLAATGHPDGTCWAMNTSGAEDLYPANACVAPANACDASGNCKLVAGQPCTQNSECLSGACKVTCQP
jgi:hypothetical protein